MLEISRQINTPLYKSDFYMPEYKTGIIGKWKIFKSQGINLLKGYYSGNTMIPNLQALLKKNKDNPNQWDTWMALSPVEMESQEFGIRAAAGNCVIMGLGMGWVAINMALKKEVDSVTVIELDPDVIDLFYTSGALDGLNREIIDKIEIINTDAMNWIPGKPVHLLYADIWLKFAEPQTINQVQEMQKNIKANLVYIWGQEIIIHRAMVKEGNLDLLDDSKDIKDFCSKNFDLPMEVPADINYGQIIRQVMENRKAPLFR